MEVQLLPVAPSAIPDPAARQATPEPLPWSGMPRLLASRWRTSLALGLFVLLTRLPALMHPKAIDDEQVYSVVAIEMLHGGKPYVSAIERKPPLLFSLYTGILRLAGPYNWPALHATTVAWTLATMALLYLIARRLFDPSAGFWAALLYGLFTAWGDYRNLALNGELLMNLPVVAALALTLGPSRSRARPGLLLAGALIAVAFLFKQPSGIAMLPLCIYVVLKDYRLARGLTWADSLLHATWLGLGFVAVLGAEVGWLRHLGILREAVYWTILSQGATWGPGSWTFWQMGVRDSAFFILSTIPLCVPAAVSVWPGAPRQRFWRDHAAEFTALGLLVAGAVLGTAVNGLFLDHYFLQLVPGLALLAAPVCAEIWRGRTHFEVSLLRRNVLAAWMLACAAAFLVVDTVGLREQRTESASARFVRDHSSADDRLFVWGQGDSRTGLYLEARRRPASRYIASFPLTGHVFGIWDPNFDTSDRIVPGSWKALEQDFARHPPRFIIDTDAMEWKPLYPIAHFPFLQHSLESGYRPVLWAREGIVYQRLPSAR